MALGERWNLLSKHWIKTQYATEAGNEPHVTVAPGQVSCYRLHMTGIVLPITDITHTGNSRTETGQPSKLVS